MSEDYIDTDDNVDYEYPNYPKRYLKNDSVYILKNELKHLHPGYLLKKDDHLETPDFLYRGKKVVIYVLSDFWHDSNNSDMDYCSDMRKDFWISKIEENIKKYDKIRNDKINQGYRVLFIYKSQIHNELEKCLNRITSTLNQ